MVTHSERLLMISVEPFKIQTSRLTEMLNQPVLRFILTTLVRLCLNVYSYTAAVEELCCLLFSKVCYEFHQKTILTPTTGNFRTKIT